MAPRRRYPVLLELVKERAPMTPPTGGAPTARPAAPAPAPRPMHVGAQSAHPPASASDAAPAPARQLMAGGRVVRMPVGYLFIAAAGVVLVFVLGWALGHQQAVRSQKRAEAQQAEQAFGSAPITDPLVADRSGDARQSPAQTARQQARSAATSGDPREAGLNYYIAASRYGEANARRAAEFLTRNGVEAVAIPDDNPPFYLVVVMPGFPRGSLSSPEAVHLKQEIIRLGKVWKRDERGPDDLSGAFLAKYDPKN